MWNLCAISLSKKVMQLPTFWAFCEFLERLLATVVFRQQIRWDLGMAGLISRPGFKRWPSGRVSADAESGLLVACVGLAARFRKENAGKAWGISTKRKRPRLAPQPRKFP
jgi:hypothetical protein